MFEWEVQTYLSKYSILSLFVLLYRKCFKPRDYKKMTTHSISHRNGNIYYKFGNITAWFIDLKLVSHFELPNNFQAYNGYSNGYLVNLHTKDNDMYVFECTLTKDDLEKMEKILINGWQNA